MSTDDRDFAAEMRAVVDAATAAGPYVPRQAAGEVVEKLRANDPDLLAGWLDQQAEQFVWQLINDRDRSTRSHARVAARPAAFGDDAAAHQRGESTRLVRWLEVPFTVADGTRRRLADLHATDLVFVAETYETRAAENATTAAFVRALAKKVGRSTVGQKFTDEQLTAMWASVAGQR